MVVSGLRIASTAPKEAADKFAPKSKSPYGDKDPNVYRVNWRSAIKSITKF